MNEKVSTARTALVTGAAGGLGREFALRLASSGHRVVLTDRGTCADLAARIKAQGGNAWDLPCDLADPAAIEGLAHKVHEACGGVDVLVNNAAFMPMHPLASMELQSWRQVMAVNVDAAFLLARALLPRMQSRGWGRIVNLASSTVWGPPPGMGAYVCSKMAIIGLTRALASEFGGSGITVNAISPGLTRHPGSAANLPVQAFDAVRSRQFIPRTEVPSDLTGALAFLVSDDAGFITGQVLNVDGGGFGF